jgi:hypothetical protein
VSPNAAATGRANLDRAFILPVWPVDIYVFGRAHGDLACVLIEGDGFELVFFVDVCTLQDVIRRIEDDERVAGDVGL